MENPKNKKFKIIITGANGQLGRCLADVVEHYPDYDFHFKTSKELDITTKERISSLFAQEKFDYCINCAAYTAVDKAEKDKENAFLVNAEAVKYLAESCYENKTILIHISTDFVFDGTKGEPYTEEDIPNPINIYGASKLKGEKYVQEILENYYIIRTSWVYSEYGHNFVKTMLRLGVEKDEISVVNDQIGSPTYAGDLARIIMEIIKSKDTHFGIFHYSNDGEISWFDFAHEIFDQTETSIILKKISSVDFSTLATRPLYSVLSSKKVNLAHLSERINWKISLKNLLVSNTK